MKSLFTAKAGKLVNQYGEKLVGKKLEVCRHCSIPEEIGTVKYLNSDLLAPEILFFVEFEDGEQLGVFEYEYCGIVDILELYNCGLSK